MERQRRTYLLTERVARECRLTPADVAFLLAEHAAHVALLPTGRRGRYRLTPAGHVGTIVAPSCRLILRPKLPMQNLFVLLDPTRPVPVVEDRVETAPEGGLLDFLAARLAQLLDERAAAGLHRSYVERQDRGPFLQGRLDLPAQLHDVSAVKDQLHCRYEDFTADVPLNQVPKATAELVLRSPLIGDEVRTGLRRALGRWAGVGSVALDASNLAAVLTPLTEAYRPLWDLCRLLADGLGAGQAAGTTSCPAFLIDLERVFERYVTRGVVAALSGDDRFDVAVQRLYVANQPADVQPDIEMRPDVTVEQGGQPVLVVDAKWKRLKGSPLVTEDLYQVLAYATALAVQRAALVYPGKRDRAWTYLLARAPVRLAIHTLRVTGSREACERSLRRLGRSLRRFNRDKSV